MEWLLDSLWLGAVPPAPLQPPPSNHYPRSATGIVELMNSWTQHLLSFIGVVKITIEAAESTLLFLFDNSRFDWYTARISYCTCTCCIITIAYSVLGFCYVITCSVICIKDTLHTYQVSYTFLTQHKGKNFKNKILLKKAKYLFKNKSQQNYKKYLLNQFSVVFCSHWGFKLAIVVMSLNWAKQHTIYLN